jgi:membrane fusion protein, multidrug efflux system
MRRIALVLVALVLVAASVSFFMKSHKNRDDEAKTVGQMVAVDVILPSRATLQRVVEVYGSLSPTTTSAVKCEVPGRILRVRVKEWDQVKAGDVLLEIDPSDFKLDLNRYEAGVKMAKAQLLRARVDLNRAKREWDRAVKLKEGGLITGQELDERRTGLESAEAGVALAEAQIGQTESQAAEAKRSLDKATVRAPIEGTVCQRSVDVGDFVDKAGMLFTVVDNRILDFTANVSTMDLPLVSQGQKLTFTVDGIPDQTFEGTIKRVNPMVRDTDRSGRIIAEVENTRFTLKGGLYARGKVVVEEHRDVTTIPKASLMGWDLEKGLARVFLVDPGNVARSVPVTTGLADENVVEVTSGLSGSEHVVVRGGFNLREGDQVQVANLESVKSPAAGRDVGQTDETAMAEEVRK